VPYIEVKVIEGVFDDERRRQIVERLTDAMVSIEGEAMRSVTTVVIDQVASGDWGIGGRALTTEDVRARAAGTAPAG
jgi:4-oxalocrotonate tautomerase